MKEPTKPVKSTSAMNKSVRLVDIAAKAGVSRTAVANVVLKSAGSNVRVSPETAKRIRKVARELGYSPNAAAQRLAGKQTKLIGTIIDSYAPIPSLQQLSEVERAADEHGYRVMIGQSHGEIKKIESYASDFIANRVDGMVCISHHYPDIGERIAKIFMRFPNVVFLGQPLAGEQDTAWVAIDHRGAMRRLVDYFIERGCKDIALCLPDQTYQESQDRKAGYIDGLRQHGLEPCSRLMLTGNDLRWEWNDRTTFDSFAQTIAGMFEAGSVDAILAVNDLMAVQLIRVLHELGKRVPDDVAVAGYDNLAITSVTIPSITTMDLCDRPLARKGFDIVLALIEGRKLSESERHQWIEPKLIPRESG